MRQNSTYILKLGGSLITDKTKPNTLKPEVINDILQELKQAYVQTKANWLIGNGAGSFAHVPAKKYQTIKGIINDQSVYGAAVVKESALNLHYQILAAGIKQGLPTFSFSASSFVQAGDYEPQKVFLSPLLQALKINLIPFFYGDVILDKKRGFTIYSTEKIIEIVAQELLDYKYKNITVIHLGITDGVLNKQHKTIPLITQANFKELKAQLTGSHGVDVTGGMLHKVEESLKLSKLGVKIIITNGLKPFMPLLQGKITKYCTRIAF